MSLIEHAPSLADEIVAPDARGVTDDEVTHEVPGAAHVVDIARESVDEAELEREQQEWAAPPRHR